MIKNKLGKSLSVIMLAVLTVVLLPVSALAAEQSEGTDLVWEDNGIPVLYLTIDPDEFSAVNESDDHSYQAKNGTIRIEVPAGYKAIGSEDALTSTEELELDYIRGRGHGTWAADKKPYKLKLKEKADLLGSGKNKNWVLLANRYDDSLLRNRMISYIGEHLGLSYTPQGQPVA